MNNSITSSPSQTIADPLAPQVRRAGWLAWWLRPKVAVPLFLLLLVLLSPLLMRGYKLSRVPTAPEPFDTEAVLNFVVPDEQNAYVEYRQALAQLPQLPTAEAVKLGESVEGEWDDVPESIRTWVRDNQAVLDLWKQGSAKPDAQNGPAGQVPDGATLMPGVQQLRTVYRLIIVDVLRLRAEGHPEQAWELLLCGIQSSDHIARRGTLFDRGLGTATHAMVSHAVVQWAQDQAVSREMLVKAQRELSQEIGRYPPFSQSLKVGYLTEHAWVQSAEFGGWLPDLHAQSLTERLGKVGLYALGEPRLYQRSIGHQVANYLRQVDKPRRDRTARSGRVESFEPDSSVPDLPTPSQIGDWCGHSVLHGDIGFDIGSVLRASDRAMARNSLLSTVLALEIYRRQTGTYPEVLESLVPDFLTEIPDDLFEPTPAPLKYRRKGIRATLWSIYEDGIDQGGQIDTFKDYGYSLGPPQPKADSQDGTANQPM